jgi:hypothetical protein
MGCAWQQVMLNDISFDNLFNVQIIYMLDLFREKIKYKLSIQNRKEILNTELCLAMISMISTPVF